MRSAAPSAFAPCRGQHGERLAGGDDFRPAADALVQRRRKPQRHPHVEVVAADRAVGAERDVDAGVEHVGNARDARGELHVRHRVVGDGRAGAGEDFDFPVVEVDAMRKHGALVEQAEMIEVAHDRAAVAAGHVGLLGSGFGGMGGKQRAVALGDGFRCPEVLRRDGVGAMRHDRREDIVGAAELVEEAFGRGDAARQIAGR